MCVYSATLSGIAPAKPAGTEVPFYFNINSRGCLSLEPIGGTGITVIDARESSGLDTLVRARLIDREVRWEAADQRSQAILEARANLEAYALSVSISVSRTVFCCTTKFLLVALLLSVPRRGPVPPAKSVHRSGSRCSVAMA